jgi:hypothetical protein
MRSSFLAILIENYYYLIILIGVYTYKYEVDIKTDKIYMNLKQIDIAMSVDKVIPNESKDSVEQLIDQVNSVITKHENNKKTLGPMVPYSKLYQLADRTDHILRYGGWLAAIITGLGLPSFVFLIGSVIDSFNPNTASPDAMLSAIKRLSLIYTLVGVGIWIFSYIYYSLLLIFAERVTKKTKVAYLKAILS